MDYIKSIRPKLGHDKIILNCAGALIVKDGRFLLQRRSDNGLWGLPGGLLELDETYEEAARREIREETGLAVRLTALLGIYHNFGMMWPNGDRAHTIGAYYTAEILSGEPRVDEESLELRFFSPDELPELFAEDHRAAVAAYLRGVRLPLLRENSAAEKVSSPAEPLVVRKAELDDDTVAQLIDLSVRWAEEGCTFGLRANTREDLREPCFLALDQGRVVGYIFGHFYIKEQHTSYVEVGSRCFEVDELFVLPEYRSRGIGKRLFRTLEAEVREQAEYLTLSTATKNYHKVLKFYVEDLGMTFHDAYLIKATYRR